MNFEEAMTVVEEFKETWCLPGLLETLEFMSVPRNREEMTGEELRAYRVVCIEMSKLFAPKAA